MEIRFINNKLEKSFTNDRLLAKTYGQLAKKVKQRYGELKAAENLAVISKVPVLRLHQYTGKTAQIDHPFSDEIDHLFRSKLTTYFRSKLTT